MTTYDHWKTASPDDEPNFNDDADIIWDDEEKLSQCDECGKMKAGCVDTTYMGMDTHVCPECRGDG